MGCRSRVQKPLSSNRRWLSRQSPKLTSQLPSAGRGKRSVLEHDRSSCAAFQASAVQLISGFRGAALGAWEDYIDPLQPGRIKSSVTWPALSRQAQEGDFG